MTDPEQEHEQSSRRTRGLYSDRIMATPLPVFLGILAIALVVEATQESLRAWLIPDLSGFANVAVTILWLPLLLGAMIWFVIVGPLRTKLQSTVNDLESRERRLSAEKQRLQYDARLHRALEMADSEDAVLRIVGRGMFEAAPERPVELLLADHSEAHLEVSVTHEPGGERAGCRVKSPRDCPAVRQGTTVTFPDSTNLDACPHLEDRDIGRCSATCVPVSVMGRATGVVHTVRPYGVPQDLEESERLESLATRTGARLGMVRILADTEMQAANDALTGLVNRRVMQQKWSELARPGASVTLAMCDLDHFKSLNDRFGHDTGDRALRVFADVLRTALRPGDLPTRHGGEEFVILLPNCSVTDAQHVLQRVREQLVRTLSTGDVPAFTFSAGLVDTTHGRDLHRLLKLADRALYQAKEAGRDRVVTAGDVPTQPVDGELVERRPEMGQRNPHDAQARSEAQAD